VQPLSEVNAVINRAKVHIIALEALIFTEANKHKQQEDMNHPLTISPISKTMVVPAVPIIMCSMRLMRRMVSFQRSEQTAS
jgi:hypothetical protein